MTARSTSDTGIPACSSALAASPEEAGRNACLTELLIRYLRPDYQNPAASSDGHRPPLQGDLSGTESPSSQSKINNPQSSIVNPLLPWPATLSAHFGRKSPKRTQQIAEILETLQGLGRL